MGRNKHYKLGKTKMLFIPEAIAPQISEIVRELDELEDPYNAIALFKTILKFRRVEGGNN